MVEFRRTWGDICNPGEEEQYKYLAGLDFSFFFKHILGFSDLNPMQRGMLKSFDISDIGKKERFVCIEAARQHGKTEFCVGFLLWVAFKSKSLLDNELRGRPWVSCLVVSGSESQSTSVIERVKYYIETNESLYHLKPGASEGTKDYQWSALGIKTSTDCKIHSQTFTSSIRGGSHQIVLCDDLLRDNKMSQSDAITSYVENIIPTTGQTKGIQMLVGTPMTGQDLFNYIEEELFKKEQIYDFKKYPAVWDADEDGEWDTVLWAKDSNGYGYTIEELKVKQKIMGYMSFAKEMLCDPRLAGEALFTWDMLNDCMTHEVHELMSGLDGHTYYLGVDVAFSKSNTADFGSFTIFGTFKDKKPYLCYQYRKKGMLPEEYEEHILNLHKKFNFESIVIEEKGLSIDLVSRLKNDRFLGPLIVGFKTGRGKGAIDDKDRIVSRLQTALINKSVQLPKTYTKEVEILYNELMNFGIKEKQGREVYGALSGHDDTVISCCLAFDAATDPNRGYASVMFI